MSSIVKFYRDLAIDRRDILYYASCREASVQVEALMRACITEALPLLQPQVCYCELDRSGIEAFFRFAPADSAFRSYVQGCGRAVLFTATLGFGLDRLILRAERQSMAKAQMLQAFGAQQAEELCDRFCADIKHLYPASKPRFSPGFGGLSLESQQLISDLLQSRQRIGVSLNAGGLMSPSKSVSAFIAVKDGEGSTDP